MLLVLLILSASGISLTKTQEDLDYMALEVEALTATYADSEGVVRLTADMLEYENVQLTNLLISMEENSLVSIDSVVYDKDKLAAQISKTDDFIHKLSANNERLVVKEGVMSFEKLD